ARERGAMHQEQHGLERRRGRDLALAIEIKPDRAFHGPVLFGLDLALLGSTGRPSKGGCDRACRDRSADFDEIAPVEGTVASVAGRWFHGDTQSLSCTCGRAVTKARGTRDRPFQFFGAPSDKARASVDASFLGLEPLASQTQTTITLTPSRRQRRRAAWGRVWQRRAVARGRQRRDQQCARPACPWIWPVRRNRSWDRQSPCQ